MNDGYRPERFQNFPRNIRVNFWVSEEEYARICKRMSAAKAKNLSAYLRSMAINGYTISLSDLGMKEILPLFHRLCSNTNQIAKRINESGRIYDVDLQELLSGQKEIEEHLRKLVERVNKIKQMPSLRVLRTSFMMVSESPDTTSFSQKRATDSKASRLPTERTKEVSL